MRRPDRRPCRSRRGTRRSARRRRPCRAAAPSAAAPASSASRDSRPATQQPAASATARHGDDRIRARALRIAISSSGESSTILPSAPGSITASCARGGVGQRESRGRRPGSACRWRGRRRARRGSRRSRPAATLNERHAEDRGVRAHRLPRGSISTRPRLPMTTTRPCARAAPRSLSRLMCAAISRTTSTPRAAGRAA